MRKIFGPDLASVHGKTVHWTPAPVVTDYVAVAWQLVEANKAVTLAADVFFVDGTAFLVTISRRINFVTAEHVLVRTATSLSRHLSWILLVCGRVEFRVRRMSMDREFEKIKGLMPIVECNTTAAEEHVSEAERTIRTIKEHTRGIVMTLLFIYIPQRMKIEFIYFTVLWLNAFLIRTGISVTDLLWELLVQWWLDYKKHCRVLPGTYCEVHDEPDPSNTMVACTHKEIALGPIGNLQDSVQFFCLNSGQVLKRRSFIAMLMTTRVIKRVNAIGEREQQRHHFCFLNCNKEAFDWMDEVPADNPAFQGLLEEEEEGVAVYPDVTAELPGVTLEDNLVDHQVVVEEEPDF